VFVERMTKKEKDMKNTKRQKGQSHALTLFLLVLVVTAITYFFISGEMQRP